MEQNLSELEQFLNALEIQAADAENPRDVIKPHLSELTEARDMCKRDIWLVFIDSLISA